MYINGYWYYSVTITMQHNCHLNPLDTLHNSQVVKGCIASAATTNIVETPELFALNVLLRSVVHN